MAAQQLQVSLAASKADIKAAQILRFQVFAEEMGARLPSRWARLDRDRYDAYCHHLLVRDAGNGEVVACTRILTDAQARLAGGFYSASEFDIHWINNLPAQTMEIGRTCVHPDYRNGTAITVLWNGVAEFMIRNQFHYLLGCASIPVTHDGASIGSIYQHLRQHYAAPEDWRVTPKLKLPEHLARRPANFDPTKAVSLPPLLKAYVRMGAYVCGEPYWDADFNVADVFILLDRARLNPRYLKHFVERAETSRLLAGNPLLKRRRALFKIPQQLLKNTWKGIGRRA
jgi:putative hemolysin